MASLPVRPPRRLLARTASAGASLLVRPYLRLHLAHYLRDMQEAAFPPPDDVSEVPGPDRERVLFIGDIGVAGYGVLRAGMAMPAQVAARRAATTGRGLAWETLAAYDMTARKAADALPGRARGIDMAVVSLGIPDVLMVTSPAEWTDRLTRIVGVIRREAGGGCRVVITGVPPIDGFAPVPALARRVLRAQAARLDAAGRRLHDVADDVLWAPFPDLSSPRMLIRDRFSFRAMHAIWAEAIAPYLDDAGPVADGAGPVADGGDGSDA